MYIGNVVTFQKEVTERVAKSIDASRIRLGTSVILGFRGIFSFMLTSRSFHCHNSNRRLSMKLLLTFSSTVPDPVTAPPLPAEPPAERSASTGQSFFTREARCCTVIKTRNIVQPTLETAESIAFTREENLRTRSLWRNILHIQPRSAQFG